MSMDTEHAIPEEDMTPLVKRLPVVRGRYTENAPLGEISWFRTGGPAEVLYKPADREDLAAFLAGCPLTVPVTVIGVMSNMIIRDGGIPGVVIRMGKGFTDIEIEDGSRVSAGPSVLDANLADAAAQSGIGGLEFLCGIPGTVGGALRMNAGAYGTETRDVLIEAEMLDRQGQLHRMTPDEMGMAYRNNDVPEDMIFTGALFQGQPDSYEAVAARMAHIRESRQASQPVRARTGGSTFANPGADELIAAGLDPSMKAWQLVEKAGGRDLAYGAARMSEKHCNFMLNTGGARARDLEDLGEEIRRRVLNTYGITLHWEIRRVGVPRTASPTSETPYSKRSLQ